MEEEDEQKPKEIHRGLRRGNFWKVLGPGKKIVEHTRTEK
jgi:hypothetical protein